MNTWKEKTRMLTQTHYPAQICQFHIQTRISTLLTKNPRTGEVKDLKHINNLFIKNKLTEKELGRTLALYCRVNYHFLSKFKRELCV